MDIIEHVFVSALHEIEALRRRLGDCIAAIDPAAISPAEARVVVAEAHQIARLGHAATTRFAIRAAEDRSWERAGFSSPAEHYAAQHGTSKQDAADTLTLAAQLTDLPELAEAVSNGRLSPAQAKAIGTAATADPSATNRLIGLADTHSLGELKASCEKVKAAADPDPEATRQRIRKARALRSWVADGVGHLHLSGPAEDLVRVRNKLQAEADERFRANRAAGRTDDGPEALLYDACVDGLLSDESGAAPKAGADAKIILRADVAAWLRGHPNEGEVCEIAGVGPVPVSTLDEWLPNAFVTFVLTNGVDVLNVSHFGRKFTSYQRTALQWRDPQCAAAGCTNTYRLEFDHDTGWAVTRTTEVGDADRLCRACHRKKTLGHVLHPPDAEGRRPLLPPGVPPPSRSAPPGTTTDEVARAAADAVAAVRARASSAA